MRNESQSLLRGALTGNGLFSITSGLIGAIFASQLADLMGVNWVVLLVIGIGVVGFGIVTLMNARRQGINLLEANLTVIADIFWVLGGAVIILIPGLLTTEGNFLLGAVSIVVAGFAILQTIGIRRAGGIPPKRLVTEVEIDARREDVWEVLVNLDAYETWNPFIVEAAGKVNQGERLQLRISPPGGKAMSFRPTVTVADQAGIFEWLGHVVIPGLFDGRHRFELRAGDATTSLVHSEEFTGILAPMLTRVLDQRTRSGFEAMNAAMKERVEARVG
jgi:hypothetical protein